MESTAKLTAALVAAQKDLKGVHKDARNSFNGYDYASAESIYRECRDALLAHGLVVLPSDAEVCVIPATLTVPLEKQMQAVTGHALLRRQYLLTHESGEERTFKQDWPVVPEKGRPFDKAVASAATASLAYFLRDLLLLPRVEKGVDLDDDERDEKRDSAPRDAPKPAPDPLKAARADAERLLVELGFETKAAQLDEMVAVIGRNNFQVKPPTLSELRAAITSLEGRLNKRAQKETSA